MKVYHFTDKGLIRQHNEDAILGVSLVIGDQPASVFAVCDGMGGGAKGQFASRTVCGAVSSALSGVSETGLEPLSFLESTVAQALRSANETIFREVTAKGRMSGTTATVLLVVGDRLSILHVGDSRALAVSSSGEALKPLTVDETWVQVQVRKGRMTEEEARRHPKRHKITNAVGVFERLRINTYRDIPVPQRVLLASDGLSEFLDSSDASSLLRVSSNADLETVVSSVIHRGSRDNASAILVDLGGGGYV